MSTVEAPPMLSHLLPSTPGVKRLTIEQTVAVVTEEVLVRPSEQPRTTHVALADEQWQWQQLRDYVVSEIEKGRGPGNTPPRSEPYKEQAIFSGFLARHGVWAPRVARYAFEVAGGYWKNAPISVNRFTIKSDEYFANVIIEHLKQSEAAKAARV